MAKRIWPKGAPTQHRLEQGQEVNLAADGLLHSAPGGLPHASYKQASSERRISGPGGAEWVWGYDRPSSQASGFGAKGGTGIASPGSATLQARVGRMAAARGGKGVRDGTQVDNSNFADAAVFYMSETTNIDKDFDLASGIVGNPKGHSAIALKADGIRLVSREGMKIVTGKAPSVRFGGGSLAKGETNSKGGRLLSAPGLDIITGNSTEPRKVRGPNLLPEEIQTLQPIALAYNVRDCFKELGEVLDDIMSIVQNTGFYVQRSMVANATALAALAPLAPPAGAAAGINTACATAMMTRVVMPMHQARASKGVWESNYLQHFSYKFIGSRSVRST